MMRYLFRYHKSDYGSLNIGLQVQKLWTLFASKELLYKIKSEMWGEKNYAENLAEIKKKGFKRLLNRS